MSSSSRVRRAQHVQPADRLGRSAGQRHVDRRPGKAPLQLRAAQLAARALDQLLERLARLVGGLADGPALAGGSLRHAAQQLWQLGLRPRWRTRSSLQRLAGRRPRRSSSLAPQRADCLDPVDHEARTLVDAGPTPYRGAGRLIHRHGRGHRRVQRLAAIGMCATCSHAATTSVGQALALGADEQRQRAARAGQRSPTAPPAARRRRRRARRAHPAARRTVRARASPTAKIAPMLARTAFGAYGSAHPGPSATHEAPNA